MDKKYIVVFIVLLLGVIIFLGGRLIFTQQTQSAKVAPTKTQQTNDNSQQGGPDLPGQPAGKEGASGGNAN